jgi:hypothetical protein
MDDQGLLLRTYDLPKIAQIKKFFDSGDYDVDLSDCMDHRVIAELLKSHLREMRDPLFTIDLYRDWMKVDRMCPSLLPLSLLSLSFPSPFPLLPAPFPLLSFSLSFA